MANVTPIGKSFQMLEKVPVINDTIFPSKTAAETYAQATDTSSYPGQIIAAIAEGTQKAYIIDNDNSLKEIGSGMGGGVPTATYIFGSMDDDQANKLGFIRCDNGTIYNKADFPDLVPLIVGTETYQEVTSTTFRFINCPDVKTFVKATKEKSGGGGETTTTEPGWYSPVSNILNTSGELPTSPIIGMRYAIRGTLQINEWNGTTWVKTAVIEGGKFVNLTDKITYRKESTNFVQEVGSTIPEPPADGKPYSVIKYTGETETKLVESTAKIPIRQGIEYTGTYYDIYLDAVNGSDSSVNPNDPATPFKTLNTVLDFIKQRTFFAANVRLRFNSGDYSSTFTGSANVFIINVSESNIGTIILTSETYLITPSLNENVILPRLLLNSRCNINGVFVKSANNSVPINPSYGSKLVGCNYVTVESGSYFVNVNEGTLTFNNCLVRQKVGANMTDGFIIPTMGSTIVLQNLTVGGNITVSNAFLRGVGTFTVSGFKKEDELKVTGNKVNLTGGGCVTWATGISETGDPVLTVPGTTYGFNGRSTTFSNPDTIEGFSETLPNDPENSVLQWRGKNIAGSISEPTDNGKLFARTRNSGEEEGSWLELNKEETYEIPTGTIYQITFNTPPDTKEVEIKYLAGRKESSSDPIRSGKVMLFKYQNGFAGKDVVEYETTTPVGIDIEVVTTGTDFKIIVTADNTYTEAVVFQFIINKYFKQGVVPPIQENLATDESGNVLTDESGIELEITD